MKIDEMLPGLDADGLKTMRANALRLSEHGNPKQKAAAQSALPLIDAETARRAELAPAPVRKTPVRKAPADKAAATKAPARPKTRKAAV